MLIHNLSSPSCKSKKNSEYLLSTVFYKDIVAFNFDFSDEEVVENYMSMLKAFAINLKPEIFSEFVSVNSFALLSGSITFMNYHDSMIKTASRTVILRIFSCNFYLVGVNSLKLYIINSDFFMMFVSTITEKLAMCDRLILSNNEMKLDLALSELSEDLYYINDILELQIKEFTENLGNILIKHLIYPVAISSIGSISRSSHHLSIPLAGTFLHYLIKILKSPEIVNAAIIGILIKEIPAPLETLLSEGPSRNKASQLNYLDITSHYVEYLEGLSHCEDLKKNSVPEVIFSFLTSKDNNLIGTTLFLLYSIINSATASNTLLLSAGLIPFEKLKIKKLLSNVLVNRDFNSDYNQTAIEALLDLLDYEHPLQIFLFKLVCKVLVSLTFRKDSKSCLADRHQDILNKAFSRSLKNLKSFLTDSFEYDEFLFEFESIWKALHFSEQKTPSLVHLLLPYNEELQGVPLEYREPYDESELLYCEIQRFFLIWSAKLTLCQDSSVFSLDVYPLYYLSNAVVWEKEKSYEVRNKSLVKCSLKLNKNEEAFFYAGDSNFLLFLKKDSKYEGFYTVKFVESLLNIEAIQDRSNPRRLVLLVRSNEISVETTFEDLQQCQLTLREIAGNKKECRERHAGLLDEMFEHLSN